MIINGQARVAFGSWISIDEDRNKPLKAQIVRKIRGKEGLIPTPQDSLEQELEPLKKQMDELGLDHFIMSSRDYSKKNSSMKCSIVQSLREDYMNYVLFASSENKSNKEVGEDLDNIMRSGMFHGLISKNHFNWHVTYDTDSGIQNRWAMLNQ